MKDFFWKGRGWTKKGVIVKKGGDSSLWYDFFKKTKILNSFQFYQVSNNLSIDFEIVTYLKNGFHRSCFSRISFIDLRIDTPLKNWIVSKVFWRILLIDFKTSPQKQFINTALMKIIAELLFLYFLFTTIDKYLHIHASLLFILCWF